MIHIKNEEEVKIMKHGGHILAEVLSEVMLSIKEGVSEIELDQLAEKLILEKGGEPGFKKVKGYNHTICSATNDVVVHGIPTFYKFKNGDVATIDCGVFYKGFHTDMADTVIVGGEEKATQKVVDFVKTGKYALGEAIKVAKAGNRIGHISKTIQEIVEGNGYSVVRSLVGHGVGKKLHEEPEVPGYLNIGIDKTPELVSGVTIAIEVIYNMGKADVMYANDDGWTIKSKDGSLSAVFEKTIVVTRNDPFILTV